MRKRNKKKQLSRTKDKREQMIKSLTNSLIFNDRIVTTDIKAKVVRSFVERLVTYAKKGTLHDRRLITGKIGNEVAVKKMMEIYGPKYKDRTGGYVRLTKMGNRPGDNAPQTIIEFI